MSTHALSGIGTKFYQWVNPPNTGLGAYWLLVAEVNSIDGPSMSRETIDVTTLGSTGGYREFVPSLKTGGSVNLGMNFTRDTYQLMKENFDSDIPRAFCIVIPDGTTTTNSTVFEFTGLVMELPLSITVDDKITADVTIQITGEPVFRVGNTRAGDKYSDTSPTDSYIDIFDSRWSGDSYSG